jgi:hypothetical protein
MDYGEILIGLYLLWLAFMVALIIDIGVRDENAHRRTVQGKTKGHKDAKRTTST